MRLSVKSSCRASIVGTQCRMKLSKMHLVSVKPKPALWETAQLISDSALTTNSSVAHQRQSAYSILIRYTEELLESPQ